MIKSEAQEGIAAKKIALCNRIAHDTFCFFLNILHKHRFQFFLVVSVIPREIEDNAYAKSKGANKVY